MSDRNVGNPGVCKHGGLRRQCETCDLAEQLDAALLKLDTALNALREIVKLADNDLVNHEGDAARAALRNLGETV